MKITVRHILFLLGLISILVSYLFFATGEFLYVVLNIGGLLLAIVSFLSIVFTNTLKQMIVWSLLGVAFILSKNVLKKILVLQSYNSIITKHKTLFDRVNNILISKKGDITFPAYPKEKDSIFSAQEINTLKEFLRTTKVLFIRKDKTCIYYPTWGIMDDDGGIFYFYSGFIPKSMTHIKGNWYYD